MKVRRLAAAVAAAAIAGGGALLALSSTGDAATPPATPISLTAAGMSSPICGPLPLPVNGSVAVKPSTLQFEPDGALGGSSIESLTIQPAPNSTDPKSKSSISPLTAANGKVSFSTSANYTLSWTITPKLLGGIAAATQTGKLIVSNDAQKCAVAVQVPTPSVSVSALPSAVNSTVNGLVGGVVSGANGALAPVNSAVGSALGQVNGTVGSVGGGLPGSGASSGSGSGSDPGGPGTTYKPTGPTVAQRRMPDGYGGGSGQGGSYVAPGAIGDSITAAGSSGTTGGATGRKGGQQPATRSGGSPKTVELAANKPRSALDGWASIIVLAAVLALSGATAFYARTYLLHPAPAVGRARS